MSWHLLGLSRTISTISKYVCFSILNERTRLCEWIKRWNMSTRSITSSMLMNDSSFNLSKSPYEFKLVSPEQWDNCNAWSVLNLDRAGINSKSPLTSLNSWRFNNHFMYFETFLKLQWILSSSKWLRVDILLKAFSTLSENCPAIAWVQNQLRGQETRTYYIKISNNNMYCVIAKIILISINQVTKPNGDIYLYID